MRQLPGPAVHAAGDRAKSDAIGTVSAEWMLTPEYREAVQDIVSRLGVKARAAGISLVFAAQRPDANVMPMQLRANLGNRLVLRVGGEGTSEIALGEKGPDH